VLVEILPDFFASLFQLIVLPSESITEERIFFEITLDFLTFSISLNITEIYLSTVS